MVKTVEAAGPQGRRQGRSPSPSWSASSRTRGCSDDRRFSLAEHDNKTLKDATDKALTAAKALGGDVHVLVAGTDCKAVAEAAAKLDGVEKVLLADAPLYEHVLAEPMAALIVSLAGRLRRDRRARDHQRQERHAARRGAARRDADLRHHQGGRRPTRSSGRSMPATRSRR